MPSSYDIIETVKTGGFDYMKEKVIYLAVNNKVGEQFKRNIADNKSCLNLIQNECKINSSGLGLYTICNSKYIKEKSK